MVVDQCLDRATDGLYALAASIAEEAQATPDIEPADVVPLAGKRVRKAARRG
jgi:hypothetical protein